jgi:hypothetical protein
LLFVLGVVFLGWLVVWFGVGGVGGGYYICV